MVGVEHAHKRDALKVQALAHHLRAHKHVKLARLDSWNARRAVIAARYLDALASTGLVLPTVREGAEPVWHLFVVRTPDRDGLAARMAEAGVATLIHYPVPPHLQPAYAAMGLGEGAFPIAERIHREVLSLPIGPHQTDAQTDAVIDAVRTAVRN